MCILCVIYFIMYLLCNEQLRKQTVDDLFILGNKGQSYKINGDKSLLQLTSVESVHTMEAVFCRNGTETPEPVKAEVSGKP